MTEKFVPRHISRDAAEQGYNNAGRGTLIGYAATPSEHESTCRYRISTGGNPDKNPHESCTCRLGLWQEKTPTQLVLDEARSTAKRTKKKKPKAASAKTHKKPAKRRHKM